MLSIVHLSASTSECRADSRLLKLRIPMSCICLRLSFQTHPQPLNCAMEVHDPSTIYILSKHMAWASSLWSSCGVYGAISFALNQAWHSLSAYLTSSRGSLSIPLKKFIVMGLPDIPDYPRIRVSTKLWFSNVILPPEEIIHVSIDTRQWKNAKSRWCWC